MVALVMMAPVFGTGPGPVELVEPAEASEGLTSWSTVTRNANAESGGFEGQAVTHGGRGLLFYTKVVGDSYLHVYEFQGPNSFASVQTIQLPGSLEQVFLPVSHGDHIYAFGSTRLGSTPIDPGYVYRWDPVTWERTTVGSGVDVGAYAAGISTGDAIYLFPGDEAMLDARQIWRFDPDTGDLTATGVTVPFSNAHGSTALWTGREIVVIGGYNSGGRVFTWTPGDDSVNVLPFQYITDHTKWRGLAVWTGASVYFFSEGQDRDVFRITLDPPSYEKWPPDLAGTVHGAGSNQWEGGGDIIWDGSDAYLFWSEDIIRFHPWESDLPRFTLGQDFIYGDLYGDEGPAERLGWVVPKLLCSRDLISAANVLAAYGELVFVDSAHFADVFPRSDICLKPIGVDSSSVDLSGTISNMYATSGSVSVILFGVGGKLQDLSWADFIAQQALGALPSLVTAIESIPTIDHQAALMDRFMYSLRRGCSEQNENVGGSITFEYYLKGRVGVNTLGWPAGGVATASLRMNPWTPGLQVAPDHLIFIEEALVKNSRDFPYVWEHDGQELGPSDPLQNPYEAATMLVGFGEGIGTSHLALAAEVQQFTATISGASASVMLADEAAGDGFGVHRVKVEFDDEDAPAIDLEVTGEKGRSNWFIGPATVQAGATDQETCVDALSVSGPPPLFRETDDPWNPNVALTYERQGVDSFVATATNHKGLSSSDDISVAIDSVAPGSSHSLSGTGQNGWYNSCVTLTINTVDSTSGPAEKFSERPGEGEVEAESREFCADGIEPFTYWAWDVAGNIEDKKEGPVLQIDRTPPTGGTGEYEGPEGYDDWYQSCVTVPIVGWDALSGFDYAEYAVNDDEYQEGEEAEVCDEGINAVHVVAHDVAGNVDDPRSSEVKVDDTDPRVETSVPFLTVIGNPAQVSYGADDVLSGLYGTIGVEMRYEPLLGEPTEFQRVCTDESYESSHSGSCEVPLDEAGRYCFRTWAGDRALNVGVSEPSCTTYAGL